MRTGVLTAVGLGVLVPLAGFAEPDVRPVAPIEGSEPERSDEHMEAPPDENDDSWSGRQAECAYIIGSWEAGETQEVVGRYGDRAAEVVEVCRLILESSDP